MSDMTTLRPGDLLQYTPAVGEDHVHRGHRLVNQAQVRFRGYSYVPGTDRLRGILLDLDAWPMEDYDFGFGSFTLLKRAYRKGDVVRRTKESHTPLKGWVPEVGETYHVSGTSESGYSVVLAEQPASSGPWTWAGSSFELVRSGAEEEPDEEELDEPVEDVEDVEALIERLAQRYQEES